MWQRVGGVHGKGGACMAKGGMHGKGGRTWQGACVAGGHAWWGGDRGGMRGMGVCVAGGHAWQGRVWQ